jgi:hypothetical protein
MKLQKNVFNSYNYIQITPKFNIVEFFVVNFICVRLLLSYPNETLKECIQFLNSRYKDVPLAIRILFLELQYIHTLDLVWKTLFSDL